MTSDTNTYNPEDPRITAYALGELEGSEQEAFEQLLEASPELQAEVKTIRALGGQLEAELATSCDEQLGLQSRSTVIQRATHRAGLKTRLTLMERVVRVAAVLVIGLPVLFVVLAITIRGGGGGQGFPSDGHDAAEQAALEEARLTGASTPLINLDEVSNVPEDGWSAGFDNGGAGLPASATLKPGAKAKGGTGVAGGGDGGEASEETTEVVNDPLDAWEREIAHRKPRDQAKIYRGAGDPRPSGPHPDPVGARGLPPKGALPPGLREPMDPTPPAPPPEAPAVPTPSTPMTPATGTPGDGLPNGLAPNKKPVPASGSHAYETPGRREKTIVPKYVSPFYRVTARSGHTSTFSVDVDTASYSNVRRKLLAGYLPHPGEVRLEEIVNYFDYGYAPPSDEAKEPFRTHIQVAACPWNGKHRLARIALKGRVVTREKRPAANLVLLVDVSGSMEDEDKLPLVKSGLIQLVENLRKDDRIAIVTYASTAELILTSTPGSEREAILKAITNLRAGGSTNGAGGIQMAYAEAQKGFRKEGVNRVLLCTDGDFNVGISDTGRLVQLIQQKAKSGVFLSVLGYGTGNYKDGKMEALSGKGNGTYAYIDNQKESRRVLIDQMEGTLVTIAKDVKFQVWFNPKTVAGWRLLGYENRRLAARDFNDDSKDAGEIGAGHEVTALYEIIPTGGSIPGQLDPNPFVTKGKKAAPAKAVRAPTPDAKALFIWRLRWKAPEGDTSKLVERNVFDEGSSFEKADRPFQWAAAASAFGMLLRRSPYAGQASWDLVKELALPAQGEDPKGVRAEFLKLVDRAQQLSNR